MIYSTITIAATILLLVGIGVFLRRPGRARGFEADFNFLVDECPLKITTEEQLEAANEVFERLRQLDGVGATTRNGRLNQQESAYLDLLWQSMYRYMIQRPWHCLSEKRRRFFLDQISYIHYLSRTGKKFARECKFQYYEPHRVFERAVQQAVFCTNVIDQTDGPEPEDYNDRVRVTYRVSEMDCTLADIIRDAESAWIWIRKDHEVFLAQQLAAPVEPVAIDNQRSRNSSN